jgi:hypothetical protein
MHCVIERIKISIAIVYWAGRSEPTGPSRKIPQLWDVGREPEGRNLKPTNWQIGIRAVRAGTRRSAQLAFERVWRIPKEIWRSHKLPAIPQKSHKPPKSRFGVVEGQGRRGGYIPSSAPAGIRRATKPTDRLRQVAALQPRASKKRRASETLCGGGSPPYWR